MNQIEAKRYAHRLVAQVIRNFSPDPDLKKSPDWMKIDLSIKEILEQHLRFGPKANDPEPRAPQPQDEPLPYDA